MHSKNRNKIAVIAISWLAFTAEGFAADSAQPKTAPAAPDTLKVPATETLSSVATAKGVQIYECRTKKDSATEYEWVFKAPEADLFDES